MNREYLGVLYNIPSQSTLTPDTDEHSGELRYVTYPSECYGIRDVALTFTPRGWLR